MLPREKIVLEFWDRSEKLRTGDKEYRNFLNEFFRIRLNNDSAGNDLTTDSLIKNRKNIAARIVAKEEGVIAGLEEFSFLNKDVKLRLLKSDGDAVKPGEVVAEAVGSAGKVLARERMNLNLIQRMSGIATKVNSLDKIMKGTVKIAATRKTLWGIIDKKAVSVGNGLTHRLSLNDGILVKENHLRLLNHNFTKVLSLVNNKSGYIEIEVENKEEAMEAARAMQKIKNKTKNRNLFAIMLDKIPPNSINDIINDLRSKNLYNEILFEASGNINENNVHAYSDCGVDIISMGSITNSAKALNMSLEIK